MKGKRGKILNPQNCGSREGTLSGCLQNRPFVARLPLPAGAAVLHPLFPILDGYRNLRMRLMT